MAKQRTRSGASKLVELSTVRREYEDYLTRERGLSVDTKARYWWNVNRFLRELSRRDSVDLRAIGAEEISRFIVREASKTRGRTIQVATTALRSFLRFLFVRGWTGSDLACSVPTVRDRRGATLPRYLPAEQVEQLLDSCDHRTPIGRRDYAILLLLARLGLRGPEVVALTLDDIDWRAGELVVRGKGKIVDRLPLSEKVGQALALYVRRDRRADTRRLFVPMRNPGNGFKDGEAINDVVHRALKRTGLRMPAKWVGAHVLRHSLATNMLRRGASLTEIGHVLRHRSANTTVIYAKVDIEGLRSISRPWPVEVRP
jgi:integrase/recombinase XerD